MLVYQRVNMLDLLSAMNYMSMDLLMVAMAHVIVDIKYIHTMFDIKHKSHIEHTISQNRFNICFINMVDMFDIKYIHILISQNTIIDISTISLLYD